MALKYTKAPISEVVFGVILKTNSLLANGILFELLHNLSREFPNIQTFPARPEDDLVDGLIQSSVDYSKSGFVTYRLYSSDAKWQILIQQNIITYHWVRADMQPVGGYPGFSACFDRFLQVYKKTNELFTKNGISLESNIKNYYLSYVDRVNFSEYQSKGMKISDILNMSFPFFSINGRKYTTDNCFNRYSVACEEINGSSIIGVNTPTVPSFGQMFIVDNKLKGYSEKIDMQDWFRVAHGLQVSFFENIFTEKILKSWE